MLLSIEAQVLQKCSFMVTDQNREYLAPGMTEKS